MHQNHIMPEHDYDSRKPHPGQCMPPDPRGYALYLAFSQQFNNQLISISESALLAKQLGRVFVLTGFLEQQGVAMERFSALEGDLEKPDLGLVTLPDRIECIVHLAARFAWNLSEHEARHTNVTGSLRVAELARHLDCRLVFITGFMLANESTLRARATEKVLTVCRMCSFKQRER